MSKTRLYHESGICMSCHEHTDLGEPCCGAPVSFEGGEYTRDSVIEADADAGLSCNCKDCYENEPCELDCESDSQCEGCRDASEDEKDRDFEWKKATGRL